MQMQNAQWFYDKKLNNISQRHQITQSLRNLFLAISTMRFMQPDGAGGSKAQSSPGPGLANRFPGKRRAMRFS